jgi:predicted CXXCH cytochrome family protein
VETCAPCHSRRGEISDGATAGRALLDDYRPMLLAEGLYFPDGQMQDEVYEYGSFLQSRMYRAGVTCSDCHDPHRLTLRADGNALCAGCHLAARFDTPAHHFHAAGSPGARCIACHMPARTYMVIDERHDHGFRVPRPDLAAKLGTPDVCTGCHTDRTPGWAAETIGRRPGPHRLGAPHPGEAIWAGRNGAAGAELALLRLAADGADPAITRATAVSLLGGYASPDALAALRRAAGDVDPLLRLAAVQALEGRDGDTVAEIAAPRLRDALRAVRLAAVQAVAGRPALDASARPMLAHGIEEYRATELAHADRPESHVNLGLLAMKLGDPTDAERSFETAIRVGPYFVPGYVNLADLYRSEQRDPEGELVLRKALAVVPDGAEAHHALGLLLVRERRIAEALRELERAAALAPDDGRYAYVLGVALHSTGQTGRALEVLRRAHEHWPADRDVLLALATISRDAGDGSAARAYTAALLGVAPDDEEARRLQQELEAR